METFALEIFTAGIFYNTTFIMHHSHGSTDLRATDNYDAVSYYFWFMVVM
jgi:hypothetical protein